MNWRVISIGTLAAHPLWGEDPRLEVRTGHATCTLVSLDDGTHILVDPSLPASAMLARLGERAPVKPHEVTHVFLTSADALHHRAITLFGEATWLTHEAELQAARARVGELLAEAADQGHPEVEAALRQEMDALERCRPAPDKVVEGVDLFPLFGVTPGCCGLLLPLPGATLLICGDAVASVEHVEQGKVLPSSFDIEQAQESMAEAIQIADLLIPGRDNVIVNPLRRPFGL